jgi:hypothetical protein
MTRRTQKERLANAEKSYEWYVTAGLKTAGPARFLSDMIARLQRGRYPSQGQRKWLDDIFDSGPPTIKNSDRVNELHDAAAVDGLDPHKAGIIKDFASRLAKGWTLSEKQEAFLTKLLAEAKFTEKNGAWKPSSETIKDMEDAIEILKTKNGWYFGHRVGTSKAYDKISAWILWRAQEAVYKRLEEATGEKTLDRSPEPYIDEWSCKKVLAACKNPLGQVKQPKFAVGAMAWLRSGDVALVSGFPFIADGAVKYSCLINGDLLDVDVTKLLKRRPSKNHA